ncbi:hypothetical protein GW17_00030332 [Ensete ventricosum]|nr:hypothetical protein GW17_00030332 [Ensete ventricosum]
MTYSCILLQRAPAGTMTEPALHAKLTQRCKLEIRQLLVTYSVTPCINFGPLTSTKWCCLISRYSRSKQQRRIFQATSALSV